MHEFFNIFINNLSYTPFYWLIKSLCLHFIRTTKGNTLWKEKKNISNNKIHNNAIHCKNQRFPVYISCRDWGMVFVHKYSKINFFYKNKKYSHIILPPPDDQPNLLPATKRNVLQFRLESRTIPKWFVP